VITSVTAVAGAADRQHVRDAAHLGGDQRGQRGVAVREVLREGARAAALLAERAGGIVEVEHAVRDEQRAQPATAARLVLECAGEVARSHQPLRHQEITDAHARKVCHAAR